MHFIHSFPPPSVVLSISQLMSSGTVAGPSLGSVPWLSPGRDVEPGQSVPPHSCWLEAVVDHFTL